jgi:peptidoglycan hydrolase FlgJ
MPVNGVAAHSQPAGATPSQAAAQDQSRKSDAAAAKKVAREFEAMFVAMMLKSMRGTAQGEGTAGGGRAEETYRSLLDQEYALAAAQGEGIGFAKSIERELSRSYGVTPEAGRGADEN